MTQNLFVGCFCAYGDLQSQWEDYGNVNIGFDFEAMRYDMYFISDREGKQNDTSGTQLVDCCYVACDDESYENVLKFVKEKFEAMDRFSIQSQQYTYLHVINAFNSSLLILEKSMRVESFLICGERSHLVIMAKSILNFILLPIKLKALQ